MSKPSRRRIEGSFRALAILIILPFVVVGCGDAPANQLKGDDSNVTMVKVFLPDFLDNEVVLTDKQRIRDVHAWVKAFPKSSQPENLNTGAAAMTGYLLFKYPGSDKKWFEVSGTSLEVSEDKFYEAPEEYFDRLVKVLNARH